MKVIDCNNSSAKLIFCPGCKQGHAFYTDSKDSPNGAVWTYNGNPRSPTFRPSMHVTYINSRSHRVTMCHSFVRDGMIQFLPDSRHDLAGQTVDLPDWEDM